MSKIKKLQINILANIVAFLHVVIVGVLLFGWSFSQPYILIYQVLLVITLVTELYFHYCLLTKWEFSLRKKLQPNLDYDYSFLIYYVFRYTRIRVNSKLLEILSVTFLILSICIQLLIINK